MSAKVMDFEKASRRCCIEHRSDSLVFLICGWMRASVERTKARTGSRRPSDGALGWSVDLVERPRKPAPEEVLMRWAAEWAKEGAKLDWEKFMPPKGFLVLPKRWVVERTIAWIDQNRRMSKDYERLCASGEAFVYAAMIRLMTRRLAGA
jgi:transposase